MALSQELNQQFARQIVFVSTRLILNYVNVCQVSVHRAIVPDLLVTDIVLIMELVKCQEELQAATVYQDIPVQDVKIQFVTEIIAQDRVHVKSIPPEIQFVFAFHLMPLLIAV